MASVGRKAVLGALLDRHGRTFAEEVGIHVTRNTPVPLFRLLCLSLLMSARIRHEVALDAARALAAEGWTSSAKLLGSTWESRTHTLNAAGYARYDERTSRMLADTAQLIADRWRGDLRRLREEADGDTRALRKLLKECKGIGDVGADIFLREVQAAWKEVRPFADERALDAASKLGIGSSVPELVDLVGSDDLSRLDAALVRAELTHDRDEILAVAR